ncbi:4-hydroxy-2-oxovalerate aldolase [Aliibacillus thermotolerans]|uniref:4-hydroxy-2-oxovalerate aldolase n=1 Tax=Aliibacillus thermotolerans TaxID=1834418 RepID=A0ABW0U8R1_9BACI|nr:4-hydroxy-2-oxovalerate aldolase [Aliibacillus thermotolerans]MDA3129600.1 4-hydroxy-2-oxovalerate aldolase [Aliibacillus thermotolerans]
MTKRSVEILDVTLRDGSHSMKHAFTKEQVRETAKGLDKAKVNYFEVSHGDGLGGSSLQYGLSLVDELELIEVAASVCEYSKISVLLLPGIGTKNDLNDAVKAGAKMVRVATHITEADVAKQHIELGRELGLKTVGFLMMAHMAPVEKLVEQAKLFESYGAEVVYVTDSAGALLPHEVTERITALKNELSCEIGFHGHNNLSMAMANTVAAVQAGATYIDGSLRALGAGSGNTQTEVMVAVLEKMGYNTGIDLYSIIDVANDVVAQYMPRPQEINGSSLIMGYSGVYSSFLLHTEKAAKRFGIDERDILIELGRMQAVGGQEDLIYEVAAKIAHNSSNTHTEAPIS